MMREIWGTTPEAITFLWKRRMFCFYFFIYSVQKPGTSRYVHFKMLTSGLTKMWGVFSASHSAQNLSGNDRMSTYNQPCTQILKLDKYDFNIMISVNEQWRAKALYKITIPGIYLHIQPETPLLPGSELLQSHSTQWPGLQLSWPGP